MVFVSTIAEISFFIATSAISEIWLSLISGETFNNKGILVSLSFFILLRETKRSLSFSWSWKSLRPSVFGDEIFTVI